MPVNVNADIRFVSKLVDILKRYFGPRFLRENAEAEAVALIARAKAAGQVRLIEARAGIEEEKLKLVGAHEVRQLKRNLEALEPEIDEASLIPVLWEETVEISVARDQARPFEYVEQRRLNNIKQVTGEALKALPPNTDVSDEPVDPDWYARYFDAVKDVSQEHMRKWWGRILAGEVVQPGSFSLRTLEVLRNMTTSEAKLFEQYCACATSEGIVLAEEGLPQPAYPDILQLHECGLVSTGSGFMFPLGPENQLWLSYQSRRIKVQDGPKRPMMVNTYLATTAGRDLQRLCGVIGGDDVSRKVELHLTGKGLKVEVHPRETTSSP